jgi:hypothetical protein
MFERVDPGAGGMFEHVHNWRNEPRDEFVYSRALKTP